jgi:hypothetical protein
MTLRLRPVMSRRRIRPPGLAGRLVNSDITGSHRDLPSRCQLVTVTEGLSGQSQATGTQPKAASASEVGSSIQIPQWNLAPLSSWVQNSNCIVALPQQRNEILLQKVLEAVVARSLEPWPPCARAFILGRMAEGTFQRIVVGYLNDVKVSKPSSIARVAKSASRSPIPNSTKTSEGRQERPVSLLCANGLDDGEGPPTAVKWHWQSAESTCAACSACVHGVQPPV